MKKIQFLGIGAVLLLAMPLAVLGVPLEGHFSGKADHNGGGGPGVYSVGEAWTAYLTLDSYQPDPPGTWYPWNTATFEYTMVISATVSAYAPGNPATVDFSPVSFAIYEDLGTAANYANVATFTDGVVVLSGSILNMHGQYTDLGPLLIDPYNVGGDVLITGGTGQLLATQCLGTTLKMNDFISHENPPGPFPPLWPTANGFEEGYDVKWDCEPLTTGTEQSTWGGVKSLYR